MFFDFRISCTCSYCSLVIIGVVVMLFYPNEIDREILMIFSTSYGSVMTYYFTKKGESNE